MRMDKESNFAFIQKILCMLPLLFIFLMFILHLALPNKTYSKEEKRYLTQWPDFHIEKVLNGSYGAEVELYFSDQFPFRNSWVHMKEGFNQYF